MKNNPHIFINVKLDKKGEVKKIKALAYSMTNSKSVETLKLIPKRKFNFSKKTAKDIAEELNSFIRKNNSKFGWVESEEQKNALFSFLKKESHGLSLFLQAQPKKTLGLSRF